MKLPEMIGMYVTIRDAKAKAKKIFDEETSRMTAAMVKLEGSILKELNDLGMESVKTEAGTAYRKTRSSCSVKDRDEFYDWAVTNGELGAIDMKANAKAVRELLNGGTQVPGVNYTETLQIGIRRPTS